MIKRTEEEIRKEIKKNEELHEKGWQGPQFRIQGLKWVLGEE